eukprot:GHVU01188447.1.p1 GENE.GHVU01188447.1~~GHVU01188447.1.p1  ORF type:complete len:109 (+),score=20.85 GHVU01188447.1:382-708(+)
MTDFKTYEGVFRLSRVLEALGVNEALLKRGAKDGDTVKLWEDEKANGRTFLFSKEDGVQLHKDTAAPGLPSLTLFDRAIGQRVRRVRRRAATGRPGAAARAPPSSRRV